MTEQLEDYILSHIDPERDLIVDFIKASPRGVVRGIN